MFVCTGFEVLKCETRMKSENAVKEITVDIVGYVLSHCYSHWLTSLHYQFLVLVFFVSFQTDFVFFILNSVPVG